MRRTSRYVNTNTDLLSYCRITFYSLCRCKYVSFLFSFFFFSPENESGIWDQAPVLGGATGPPPAAARQLERGALSQAQHGQPGGAENKNETVLPTGDTLTLCCRLQVSHLQELVREGEQNLGSAQTQISCLRETQEKLKIELDATRSRVRETSNLLTDLQVRMTSNCEGFYYLGTSVFCNWGLKMPQHLQTKTTTANTGNICKLGGG